MVHFAGYPSILRAGSGADGYGRLWRVQTHRPHGQWRVASRERPSRGQLATGYSANRRRFANAGTESMARHGAGFFIYDTPFAEEQPDGPRLEVVGGESRDRQLSDRADGRGIRLEQYRRGQFYGIGKRGGGDSQIEAR